MRSWEKGSPIMGTIGDPVKWLRLHLFFKRLQARAQVRQLFGPLKGRPAEKSIQIHVPALGQDHLEIHGIALFPVVNFLPMDHKEFG